MMGIFIFVLLVASLAYMVTKRYLKDLENFDDDKDEWNYK